MIVSSFIIQANFITIVNYDRKTFIVQATDLWFLNWKGQRVDNGTGTSEINWRMWVGQSHLLL